jgi:hypothetical protein
MFIYIASHLHVVKDSWTWKKNPQILINWKLKKYENLKAFKMCPIIPYYYKKNQR